MIDDAVNAAINPLEGEASKQPELERKVEYIIDDAVKSVLEKYAKLAPSPTFGEYQTQIFGLELLVLTPTQINIALQHIIQTTPKEDAESFVTGLFLTRLIQDSYQQGNETFLLNTQDTQISNLAYRLEATNLKLTIKGNLGYSCGSESKGCSYIFESDAKDNCGFNSRDCTYVIKGNVGYSCGELSKGCSYTVEGDVGYSCGSASLGCSFVIDGNAGFNFGANARDSFYSIKGDFEGGCGWNSERCTFQTSNKQTYKHLKKLMPWWKRFTSGNKVKYTRKWDWLKKLIHWR